MVEVDGETREPCGTLYVVATPIGNLADLSPRAAELLAQVDWIACEDTRHSQRLFQTGTIVVPEGRPLELIPYHDHNEQSQAMVLVRRLSKGERGAVISDAGTPCLSDPGFRLVRECHRHGIPVRAVPGPNAAVAALSVSGLPSNGFLFVGFLPPKRAARRLFLENHQTFDYTIVLYESRHRIAKVLEDIMAVYGGERVVSVARELTKGFETVFSGPAQSVQERVLARSMKGEFVVLIAPGSFQL